MDRLWHVPVLVCSFLVISSTARAENRKCVIEAGVDSTTALIAGGCEWYILPSRFSLGSTITVLEPMASPLTPTIEINLTWTVTVHKRWLTGGAVGGAVLPSDGHVSGYTDVLLFFSGKMAVAPYASVAVIMRPTWLGATNRNEVELRPRIAVRTRLGKSAAYTLTGLQSVSLDLFRSPQQTRIGAFVLLVYKL